MLLQWWFNGTFTPTEPEAPPDESLAMPAMEAIRDRLRELYDNISENNIQVRKVWDGTLLNTPNCLITTAGPEHAPKLAETNYRDETGYMILVTWTDKKNRNQVYHRDEFLTWREQFRREFHCQPLSEVDEAWICEVVPRDVRETKWWRKGWWVSRMVLLVNCRETRG